MGGRIVAKAVRIAVAVNAEGVREVLGMAVNPSEAETFWSDFLRSLTRRGLRDVKLVISDAHEGLKAAAAKVPGGHLAALRGATSCVMRWPTLARGQRRMVLAAINTVFAQDSCDSAIAQWVVADQLRPKFEKLSELLDGAEAECPGLHRLPKGPRTSIHTTIPLEKAQRRD